MSPRGRPDNTLLPVLSPTINLFLEVCPIYVNCIGPLMWYDNIQVRPLGVTLVNIC